MVDSSPDMVASNPQFQLVDLQRARKAGHIGDVFAHLPVWTEPCPRLSKLPA